MTHQRDVWIGGSKWLYQDSKKNKKRFSGFVPGVPFYRQDKTCGHKTVDGKGIIGRLERKTK